MLKTNELVALFRKIAATCCERRTRKEGTFTISSKRSNHEAPGRQIRIAEFPFNREQCWEFATRVRAELMAIIAFHADLFRYSRLSRQIRSGIYQGSVPGTDVNEDGTQ
jgi:hypothetical protein